MPAKLLTGGVPDPISVTGDIRWFPIKNLSGEVIPPYSVVRITSGTRTSDTEGRRVYAQSTQPNDDDSLLALTGPQSIAIDGWGVATQDSPAWMAYDEADGVPAAGDKYTADRGSWVGVPAGDREDFTVLGPAIDDEDPTRVLVMQHNLGDVSTGNGRECCGPCVDDSLLTEDDLYAETYTAHWIPTELGGPTVTLNFVGLLPHAPSDHPAQLTNDDLYCWESDTFEYTCDDGTDVYFWRLLTDADGNSTCKAGTGRTVLYLVRDSSAAVCTDLSEPRCTGTNVDLQFVQYESIEHWRARCGSKLWLRFPQFQQPEIEALLACAVCIAPFDPNAGSSDPGADDIAYADLNACWKSILDAMGRTTLPGSLYIKLNTMTPEQDGGGEDYLDTANDSLWRLDFDTGTMTYKSIVATTAPDCAGSATDPDNFKRPARINPDSELADVTPVYPSPLVYFEISCVDADTIRVETFTRKDWKVSNDGSTDACSETVDLDLTTDFSGTFTNYLHAVRASGSIDILAGQFDWELEE